MQVVGKFWLSDVIEETGSQGAGAARVTLFGKQGEPWGNATPYAQVMQKIDNPIAAAAFIEPMRAWREACRAWNRRADEVGRQAAGPYPQQPTVTVTFEVDPPASAGSEG